MSKSLFVAAVVAGGVWFAWHRAPAPVAVASPPPEVRATVSSETDTPLQKDLGRGPRFVVNGHEVQALAEYAVTARVLSAKSYRSDRESDLSQLDLALGWGQMSRPAVYERLSISQSGRWYFWRYENGPPIPHREIETSSANVHMIPASPAVARVLEQAERGKVVSLRGYLVEVKGKDGWSWRSSLSRSDTGNGSCEVMFVQSAQVR